MSLPDDTPDSLAHPPRGMSYAPALYRVSQFCEMHGISRSTFYREVRAGRLHIIKLGPNSTGVLTQEAQRWLQTKVTSIR